MALLEAMRIAAPYYNLGLSVVMFYLFYKLFKEPVKRGYLQPWKVLFLAVIVYLAEEVLTALRAVGLVAIKAHINGFFELAIITIFIYALLLQKKLISEPVPLERGLKHRSR